MMNWKGSSMKIWYQARNWEIDEQLYNLRARESRGA